MSSASRTQAQRLRLHAIASVIAAAATLVACDGVGRAIVDLEPVEPVPQLELGCRMPPGCAAFAPVELPPTVPSELVEPLSLTTCEPRFEDCVADISADDDAGIDDCGQPRDLAELAALAGQDVSCRELAFSIPEDGAATWTVPRLTLSHVNLSIAAKRTLTIELPEALIEDSFIQLQGPVTLAISDARGISDARIRSEASALGTPTVTLRDSPSERLAAAGRDGERFEGELAFLRSELTQAQLVARAVELESVAVKKSAIDTERFDTADVRFDVARLSFSRARITATDLNKVEVLRCGSLALLQSTASDSSFPACSDEPARMYGSTLHHSWVNGAIDADKTSYDFVVFGTAESVELIGWDANMEGSTFCGANDRLQLFGGLVECTACVGASLADYESVCNIPIGFESKRNSCKSLIRAPMCWPPLPVRARPEQLK